MSFSSYKLILFGMVAAGFSGLTLLLFKTDFGRMVRASIQEKEGAIITEVPIGSISLEVFSLGSGIAALAGALYAGLYPMTAHDCSFGAMIIGLVLPRSRLGYQLELIGWDLKQAEAAGVPVRIIIGKIYVLCAMMLALGGGLFMMGEGYLIRSTVFGLRISLLPVAMAMVGGLRNPLGPLLGTAVVFGVEEWLWSSAGGMEQSLLGVLLILAGKRHALIRLFFPRYRQ